MKAKMILSAIISSFFALCTYFLLQCLGIQDALLVSVFGGLLFCLMLFSFLLIYSKVTENRYAEFEKSIASPVFYKTNGNFNLGTGKVKNGNIYFCEAGIVCVGLDEKPYTSDVILIQDIDRFRFENIYLYIFAKDGRLFVVTLPDVKKVMEALKQKGWIID